MTIAEIIALETARQEESQLNVIHLLKEGDFYRAHDWSAWLMSAYPIVENLDKPLKVLAKKLKDGYVDAWIGFPASSLGKYIPNDGSIEFKAVSDNQLDVTIQLPADVEKDFESMNKMKEDWKASLAITVKKQARENREIQEQAPRIIRFSDIISSLISLPIEDMSPRDAWDYLRDLRRQVTAMF